MTSALAERLSPRNGLTVDYFAAVDVDDLTVDVGRVGLGGQVDVGRGLSLIHICLALVSARSYAVAPPVVINEVLAGNATTNMDMAYTNYSPLSLIHI